MSQLVIHRKKALWQDRARDYRVFVDGVQLGHVENGSVCTVSVEPGMRNVQLRIDWCESKDLHVDISHGESVQLECGPNATPLLALFQVFSLRKSYVWLRQVAVHDP